MSNVIFEEEQHHSSKPVASRAPKGIVGLVIKSGLAKDEKAANIVLLTIIGICVLLIIGLLSLLGEDERQLTDTEQFQLEQSTPLPPR